MGLIDELAVAREKAAKKAAGISIADVEEALNGPTELIHKDHWRAIVRFLRDEHHPTRWQHVVVTQRVPGYRPGWAGVWDHVKAVWNRRAPNLIDHSITISAWTKAPRGAVKIAAVVEESRPRPVVVETNPGIKAAWLSRYFD